MKLILIYLILFVIQTGITLEIDESGYIAYCPCMGRFGNQADHFLGSLAFAHGLNRTLILPPWVEYRRGESKSLQLPFETYFQVEPLNKFHRVITMHDFMADIAPNIWPPEKRVSFCYMARKGIGKDAIDNDCNAKNGNPFGPFWDTFGIDFVSSEFYEPLNYDIHHHNMGKKWSEQYPADQWPVYAFTGAPASFPVQEENRDLHQYLIWNEKIIEEARSFIKTRLPKGAFIGLHLRNGMDWIRACEHVDGNGNLFASAQCLGYRNEKGVVTMEMCFPPIELITKQIKRQIKQIKELNPKNEIRSIFVASDNNHFIGDLNQALRRMNINAYKLENDNPHLDLAILGLSNHFIGNCVSSYTSFVKRERDVKNFPSTFWGFPKEAKSHKFNKHEEL